MFDGPRVVRTMFVVGLLFVATAAAVWWQIDRLAAEKVATSMAMPCGVLWYLAICLVCIAWHHAHARVLKSLTIFLVVYSILGNGLVAEQLTRTLESPFYEIEPGIEDPYDVVIVLGGGASVASNGRVQGNNSGDRIILAAELFHAGVARKLVCSGTRIASLESVSMDASERSRRILTALGVPESAVIEIAGRNTSEEMASVREQFGDDSRIGVITSAWHMTRTLRLAKKQGLDLQPLPADFLSGPPLPKTTAELIQCFIPQADAMNQTTKMLREYLGIAVGR